MPLIDTRLSRQLLSFWVSMQRLFGGKLVSTALNDIAELQSQCGFAIITIKYIKLQLKPLQNCLFILACIAVLQFGNKLFKHSYSYIFMGLDA